MGFASLGSGSRGNGTVVALRPKRKAAGSGEQSTAEADGKDCIFLVDCGFSLRQTEARLKTIGLSGGDLDGILVSHEHADHIAGVPALAHKYAVPVYASYGTARKLDMQCHTFDGDVPFDVQGVHINPVRVPHDAREPTQFVLSDGEEQIGVLSDLGCVTQHVVTAYTACTHLLVEANHDLDMLRRGSYPPRLKTRVAERFGHLNNEQALDLLQRVAHADLHVVIGHVSEQNNDLGILERLFEPIRADLASLRIASQSGGFAWIGRRPLTRQVSFADAL